MPTLNKAAEEVFYDKEEVACELGFADALVTVEQDIIFLINDQNERRQYVRMMLNQEIAPDVIIHTKIIEVINKQLAAAPPPTNEEEFLSETQQQLLIFYKHTIEWLANAGFLTREQSEELLEDMKQTVFIEPLSELKETIFKT